MISRLLAQLRAFHDLTCECSKCSGQTPLWALEPTLAGLLCHRCLLAMPSDDYARLQRAAARIQTRARWSGSC